MEVILRIDNMKKILSGIASWLIGTKSHEPIRIKEKPLVIGDWRSSYIEERAYGKSHYCVNNLNGLIEILDKIENWNGRGGATINWWVSGQTVKTSAYVDVKVLNEMKKKMLGEI